MIIEAVVVCINYSDFLKVTLPTNKSFFNRIVVVTDENDKETKAVCEFYNVECVATNDFYEGDSKVPNKAKGINKGLSRLSKKGWIIQLDADIWLPPLTRDILERIPLDDKCIYGIDRYMCDSYEEWFDFSYTNLRPLHEAWIYLHMHRFPIGQRIVQYKGDGYMPIGYFQLWNPSGSGVCNYPTESIGFDRSDVIHLKQFDRPNRKLIPELICVHLSSEKHFQGQNWKGRISKNFLPAPGQVAWKRFVWFLPKMFNRFRYRIIVWLEHHYFKK